MTIGQRLKQLRGGLSQAEAAAKLGMKQQSWRVYEADGSAPGAGLIKRICATFGVTADWLLGMDKPGGIVAHNSAVVIGSGTAVNGSAGADAHAHTPAYGHEPMCKRCPYKRQLGRLSRLIKEGPAD